MVLTKSIKVSEKAHKLLIKRCPKSKSYNDIIYNALVEQYTKEEYLTDEEAKYCSKMIYKLEKEDYSDTYEIKTSDLDKIDELEANGII